MERALKLKEKKKLLLKTHSDKVEKPSYLLLAEMSEQHVYLMKILDNKNGLCFDSWSSDINLFSQKNVHSLLVQI